MYLVWFIILFLLGIFFTIAYIDFKFGYKFIFKFKHKLIIRKKIRYIDENYIRYAKTSEVIRIFEEIRKKYNVINSDINYSIVPKLYTDDIYICIYCSKAQLLNIKLEITNYCDYFYVLKGR